MRDDKSSFFSMVNNELTAALVLCFYLINGVIGIDGISNITIAVIWICYFINLFQKKAIFKNAVIFPIIYISIIFLISYIFVPNAGNISNYSMRFYAFCIISMIIGMQKIDVKKTLSYINIIGIICVILLNMREFDHYNTGEKMGISYAMLPVLLSGVIVLFLTKKYKLIALANIILIMRNYISIAPRGVWVSVALFLILFSFVFLKKNKIIHGFVAQTGYLVLMSSLALWFNENMEEILKNINDFFKRKLRMEIYAIDKYIRYLNKDDVFNGRDIRWQMASECIKRSPIIGNGIGYFETLSNGSYTHNIFLQAMSEAGLFFLIPIIVIIYRSIKQIFSFHDKLDDIERAYISMLFIIGIVVLCYSSVYWMWPPFWYLVGFVL